MRPPTPGARTNSRTASLGPRYWAGLSIASVFGAGLGDVLSHDLRLGHWRGVPPLALLFWLARQGGRAGWLGTQAAYWSAVVVVRAAATNVADLASHDLRIDTPLLIAGLAALMLAVLLEAASWRPGGAGRPAAPAQADLPGTGGPYWLVLFLAGTLGTVLGDDTSGRFGLVAASILLCAVLSLLFVLRARGAASGRAGYWTTVLAARSAGTSVGDLLADRTPLGLAGSTALEGLLLVGLLLAWPRPRPTAPAPTSAA